jgi:2',3'-cyclic-nucleotide 2'-phosphodiesterase (5'-nucleotidase family)
MLNLSRTAVLACFLALAACTVTRENPNLVGQDVRVTVIHTSDIHSRLFPYNAVPNRFDQDEHGLLPQNAPFGGAARMATVIKEERGKAARSIWLDSGDCFQGAPVFNMFKGEAEFRALSLMGMDGAVVGNHEFDLGSANLIKQIDNWAQFPLLAANYEWEDPPNPNELQLRDIIPPYQIYDLNGVKFGVIGMANWSSMTGIFEGGNSLGIRPRADDEVVTEYVRLLRPIVDVVTLVSHLGLSEDEDLGSPVGEDPNLILPLEGVDLILGGHLHIVLNPPRSVPSDEVGNSTVLVHSGAFAKYVGRIDLVVRMGSDNNDPQLRSKITAFTADVIPIDSTIPDDPEVTELLEPYSIALNREIDLDGVFAYADGSRILRRNNSGGDSQLGNLVARAMQVRPGVEAEFALTNSLGIRTDFEEGPLNIEQMFNVFPFENTITVMFLSGSEIQEMLDFVTRRSASRGCASQAQVAGIWFDMVCQGTCPEDGRTACAKNIVLGEDCRDDQGNIDTTKCAPIAAAGLYKVAVNDFIARGGSGFDVLERNTSKQDTGVSLRDALIDFVRNQPPCDAGVVDVTDTNLRTVEELWGSVACLDDKTPSTVHSVEQTDGRIKTIFE